MLFKVFPFNLNVNLECLHQAAVDEHADRSQHSVVFIQRSVVKLEAGKLVG